MVARWRETLPNGVGYETLDTDPNGFLDDTDPALVPTGRYYVLGDNRDNSTDSRRFAEVGFVTRESILGRVAGQ